ncbi:hypothetical protein A1OE_1336 [Candidatus Endolissoclinum faulkneri L2]|uniref:Uncharacterized protein n=1 Tax=Candidatus Endolissoclinum faulkneri L2 TaxID=1193729 RepID=K7YSK8_9PROT|nr:hypothetical protein A1OE_1336 [Candidatus Endolissoclinum faulkneri L2]
MNKLFLITIRLFIACLKILAKINRIHKLILLSLITELRL